MTASLKIAGIIGVLLIALSAPASAQFAFFGNEIAIGGEITLKSGNTLIVRNGGIDTRVVINQDTRIIDRTGQPLSYSVFELGDRIQAFGILTDTRTLSSDTIRNLVRPDGGFQRVITGTVADRLGNIVTVRSGGENFSILLDQDSLILDRIGSRLSLSALERGDRIRAFGELETDQLSTDTIINLSLAYAIEGLHGAWPPSLEPVIGSDQAAIANCAAGSIPTGTQCAPLPLAVQLGLHMSPLAQSIPANGHEAPRQQPMPAPAPVQAAPAETAAMTTFVGVLTGRSKDTLTAVSGGEQWLLRVDSSSLGMDRDGTAMSFARMRIGDTIQITGRAIGSNVLAADAIRDLSVSFAAINAAKAKGEKQPGT